MPPESLRCKECKTPYPLDARYVCERCFGPLEVAYASRAGADPDGLKRRIQAGPQSIWRYADFLPVSAPPRGTLPAGWTPLLRADRLCTELSGEHEWAFVNINMRPYYAEGSKTLAFETVEQLGFELPDRVVCPIASGSLYTKIARGFEEWLEVGLISGELPVFNGAQAEGCSPVATAFEAGQGFCRPVKPNTIGKSLA